MRRRDFWAVALCIAAAAPAAVSVADDCRPETVIALERAALDRWGKGDPSGYLEIYAPGITYFDPGQERRVDGIEAMTALLAPLKGLIKLDRFEIVSPDVYRNGDVAVLSYNLVTYGKFADGPQTVTRGTRRRRMRSSADSGRSSTTTSRSRSRSRSSGDRCYLALSPAASSARKAESMPRRL